ncbi:hypothetical protein R7D97_25495 [Vibrio sp. Vb5031]|uniref:Uncharacterized protein n=1 Tax=Vibrio hepatarius TaxID=171383 RepID=A0A0M0HU91_9VIBR|nr:MULTISPECIES: hypothetical protein [Vibrio]KOO05198.1 hypothetical protein AKJ31_21585 [Vibrio hepatarius]MCR9817920.1 hypothetical protein [Vibrio parahaemolyticus]MDW1507543.1 hypothetical protein [Vibrio sp. Vb5031]MDW1517845.1 hypothetical protein [Vibrio sp. Vb5035]MDW1548040.1 hypothetical protein [Vibrio sp. Vb5034]
MLPFLLIPFIGTVFILTFYPVKIYKHFEEKVAPLREEAERQRYVHDFKEVITHADGRKETHTFNMAASLAAQYWPINLALLIFVLVFVASPMYLTFSFVWSIDELKYLFAIIPLAGLVFIFNKEIFIKYDDNPNELFHYFWAPLAVTTLILAWGVSDSLYDEYLSDLFFMNKFFAWVIVWTCFYFPLINCLNIVLVYLWNKSKGKKKRILKVVAWLIVLAILCFIGYLLYGLHETVYQKYLEVYPDADFMSFLEALANRAKDEAIEKLNSLR